MRTFPKITILIALFLLPGGNRLFGQSGFFRPVPATVLPPLSAGKRFPAKMAVLQLDPSALRTYLLQAPLEFAANTNPLPLEIPLPDGSTELFQIVESPVLAPAVAAAHPDIRTYTGKGTKNGAAIIRFSLTSSGFNAAIINIRGESVYFEQYAAASPDLYYQYFTKDATLPKGTVLHQCGVGEGVPGRSQQAGNIGLKTTATGAFLTTYRLAMAADGEFTGAHGGTKASAFNTIVEYVNRINLIYRNELAVRFVLVSDTNVVYTDPATDPYTNSNQITMLTENQATLDAIVGNDNYDIGHVWGLVGGSGGGIAVFESLCVNSVKGQGVSGEGELAYYAQVFMDQLVAHEMGHQFGMSHSYNSSIPVCTTRNPATSAEPGSGATIMSYGFTCNDATGNDDYLDYFQPMTGPILQFHTVSYQQAVAYMATLTGGTTVPTANTPPVILMPPARTIPKSTPFYLTGSATDVNAGDVLSYCWEGADVGTITPTPTTFANTAEPPFFRSYGAVSTSTRIYPVLDSILSGANYSRGDKLPSIGIVTKHVLSVRDNNAVAGGLSLDSVSITVDGSIGPFLETTNLAGSYASGSVQTITWSVNGTSTATPNVKISLSTDGGYTFPYVLAASSSNDGSEPVMLPNVATTQGRIKVEAVGNIFFDISNSNFTILGAPLPLTLLGFEARLDDGTNAACSWEVVSPKGIFRFDIEQAAGTGSFKPVVQVSPDAADSRYSSTVHGLSAGANYFRLKITGEDGQLSYSPVRLLQLNSGRSIELYPQPADGTLHIALTAETETAQVRILNGFGQLVGLSAPGGRFRTLDVSGLSAGPYLVEVAVGGSVVWRRKIAKK